jgi:hypothetical protein
LPSPIIVLCHHLLGKNLTGWEEIRQALEFVEGLKKQQENSDPHVEVYEYSGESSLKVTFCSVGQADGFLQSPLRRRLLKEETMNEVYGRVIIN